jgi:hypothetical protein
MSTPSIKALERSALDAHRRGLPWSSFWLHNAVAIREAGDSRLIARLLALVVSGDLDGQEPAGDAMPWQIDDESTKPADVGTAARIDWQAAGIAQEATR